MAGDLLQLLAQRQMAQEQAERARRIQELERQGLINQPRPGDEPVQLPPQIGLGQLAAQMPIRGRGLPIQIGSLGPLLKGR